MRKRYQAVNAIGLPRIKLDDAEALAGARRLYRHGRKLVDRPFTGTLPLKIVSGNRRTFVRGGVINPRDGWRGIVHSVSHAIIRLHTPAHEWLERQLAEYVCDQGWLDGKLRKPEKPIVDKRQLRHQRVLARIAAWQTKAKRAANALKKLARQKAYYERTASP